MKRNLTRSHVGTNAEATREPPVHFRRSSKACPVLLWQLDYLRDQIMMAVLTHCPGLVKARRRDFADVFIQARSQGLV